MNIKPGTRILINKDGDKLILETVPSFTQKLTGATRRSIGDTPEGVDTFVDQERKERDGR
jgi:hypothetical protein